MSGRSRAHPWFRDARFASLKFPLRVLPWESPWSHEVNARADIVEDMRQAFGPLLADVVFG